MIIKAIDVIGHKIESIIFAADIRKQVSWIPGLPKNKEEITSDEIVIPPTHLIDDAKRLVANCIAHEGAGLSANQIGIDKRMFVIKIDEDSYKVYFHPTAIPDTSVVEIGLEGCLSAPNVWINVARTTAIIAEWFELENDILVHKQERLEGMMARVYLHELDHLLGKTILDYANRETRRKLLKNK